MSLLAEKSDEAGADEVEESSTGILNMIGKASVPPPPHALIPHHLNPLSRENLHKIKKSQYSRRILGICDHCFFFFFFF